LGAGAAGLAEALPLRRSYAEPATKEYRITAKSATVNLAGKGHRPPLLRGVQLLPLGTAKGRWTARRRK